MTDELLGPIDLVVLEFPEQQSLGEVADSLASLVETGVIRLYDILAINKDSDGSVVGIDLPRSADGVGLAAFAGARSGLIGDDDVTDAGEMISTGSSALMLMYENAWAVPMVAATRRAQGDVVALAHLTGQQVNDALDALDKEG